MRNPVKAVADVRGSAAVEFALVGPLFVVLIIGLVVYGGWFWMAQGVQHLAAEGARASIAGLDPAERELLARSAIGAGVSSASGLDPDAVTVAVDTTGSEIRVSVSYSVAGHPLMALAGLVPAPPSTIVRAAVVRIGGY